MLRFQKNRFLYSGKEYVGTCNAKKPVFPICHFWALPLLTQVQSWPMPFFFMLLSCFLVFVLLFCVVLEYATCSTALQLRSIIIFNCSHCRSCSCHSCCRRCGCCRERGSAGLRDSKVAGPGRDSDVGLAAAFRLDEILHADIRRVATMLRDVPVEFSVDRARNRRDIP